MIIIETCPICGHDLINEVICTYPPIPRKYCPNCNWFWEGEREETIRVPFEDNKHEKFDVDLKDLKDVSVNNFISSACDNCSCNPKNGGSGVCNCTLGDKITY